MAYTAIVLDEQSRQAIIARTKQFVAYAVLDKPTVFCHHVTLGMRLDDKWIVGERRTMTVTHLGYIAGRIMAFAVSGVHDSDNAVPHVTLAASQGVKPRESNEITKWLTFGATFTISGTIEICK
jgi:hypothetical protein